jgi:hypothetical protein
MREYGSQQIATRQSAAGLPLPGICKLKWVHWNIRVCWYMLDKRCVERGFRYCSNEPGCAIDNYN